MKKYIVSILVASVFLMGAPFVAPKAIASDLNIRDFINLLVAIGVITPDRMPAVNAFLATLDNTANTPTVNLTTPISTTQPSITVLSPNGGETYSVRETMKIKWSTENLGSLNVELDLIDKGGNIVRDIAGPIYNRGSYSWAIPKDIVPLGTTGAFRIMISSVDKGPSAQDFSNSYFNIVSAIQPTATILTSSRITATSPYIIGTASGVSQVGIVLSSESGDKVYGSGMVPVVNGDWSVTVTPSLPLGNYTIYVYDINNNKLAKKALSIVSSI